ncbi:C2H2 finger domain transcription factor crzA [Penicillium diatomitis]|uniref:C2H2 finger domain transcription factor crzA n=1 Tax=Penicillium diatomitis TaxID=2819901 RepID=A0A9X0BNQ3_9EURO|nr:C2H2 finger domain transcription factor crzA [Penicillium diatomitis]KAJ5477169.1 C2H2 finger domain transcription factor crzA [Penicillium diatomitis]
MASHDHSQGLDANAAHVKTRSVSPSPHAQPHYHDPTSGLALDPSMSANFNTNPPFNPPQGDCHISNLAGQDLYGYSADYSFDASAPNQTLAPSSSSSQTFPPLLDTTNMSLQQTFDPNMMTRFDPASSDLQSGQGTENFSNLLNSNPGELDFSAYQNNGANGASATDYNSSLFIDTQMQPVQQAVNSTISPADIVSPISNPSASSHPSTHDLQQSSPGPMSPPGGTPGTFYTPQHSRHASLDPATAAYMGAQANADWPSVMTNNTAFHGHRRAPSEVSEVSSATHSPYLSQNEFDNIDSNVSPSLAPQSDPALYDNALAIEQFTLSEQHQQGFSPAHSPYISPRLMPQQGIDMIPSIQYTPTGNQFPPAPTEMYGYPSDDLMAARSGGDIGQASQMAPPSINVEFAPPSRTPSFGPSKPMADFDSLSPPAMRSRGRSKSDPFAHPASRPRSPAASASSLEPIPPTSPRSLSPQSRSNPGSRDASPARSNRRLSTSSIESRNYILDLADPGRPGAAPGDSKRVQKHPATFQCTLCPKRFTRAYNLRSHLRTHTDERPFVCTVCGKAFARQHDRKRHEGLHSGEKKFVCRGDLTLGGQWGCGRRFARADALGRHFRSEAGRICIKPLLDEESQERERVAAQQQQQQQQQQQSAGGHLQPVPQQLVMPGIPGMDGQASGTFVLPAALLAQYPALQNLQWDQLAAGSDDPSDIGGRSSFDASSGGEYGFDEDESSLSGVSGMSSGYASNQANLYPDQMLNLNAGSSEYADQKWL